MRAVLSAVGQSPGLHPRFLPTRFGAMSLCRGGYSGRFLRVDLDECVVTVEETPDVTRWLGPRGWNALIGWNEVQPGVGAFDPGNRIVFSVGPLVGTCAPTSGRTTV